MNETIKIREAYFEPPYYLFLILKDDRVIKINLNKCEFEVV